MSSDTKGYLLTRDKKGTKGYYSAKLHKDGPMPFDLFCTRVKGHGPPTMKDSVHGARYAFYLLSWQTFHGDLPVDTEIPEDTQEMMDRYGPK